MMHLSCVQQYLNDDWLSYLYKKCPHQTQEETLRQTEECLRFLSLTHLAFGNIPVNQKIDDIWHLLILETEAYAALCYALPGKAFIHHTSDDFPSTSKPETAAETAKRQLEWLVNYIHHFGPLNEEMIQYWPFARTLMAKLKLSIDDFSEKLLALKG